ncbi:MAG: LPS translocon maturation chaperone LptM [Betaproteobacteria bacterium]
MSRIPLILFILGLAACGNKAALTLPPGPAPAPLLGTAPATPKPALKPQETPAKASDGSTPGEAAK